VNLWLNSYNILTLAARIFKNGNDDSNKECLQNCQNSVDEAGVPQCNGTDAESGAEEEDEKDRFSPIAKNSKKTVMDMIGTHIIDPILKAFHLAGDDTLYADIGHVVDQDPEDENGSGKRDNGIVVRPGGLDGQGRKDEPDEGAPGVA